MRLISAAVLSLLAMSLALLATSVVADVVWTDDATDPQGDVRDSFGNVTAGKESVDILDVHVGEDGTDLNVTLALAGARHQAAEYRVDLLADGSAGYRFTWNGAFAARGPSGTIITVDGRLSRDGTVLSWTVSKSAVPVTATLRIQGAKARLAVTGALAYTDTAKGTPSGGVQLPRSVEVLVVYQELHLRNVTIKVTYEGANASAVRSAMDRDSDGSVSAAEASAYATGVRQRIARDASLSTSTLDGRNATRVTYGFDLQGAEGAVTGTGPVRSVMTQTMEFPQPLTRDTHAIVFAHDAAAIGGDEPWDKKALGDDPWGDECIGGDEPWDNVFFGGVEPWGAQAIGGDEPWDNKVNVVFRMEAPEGWRFATDAWPAGMSGYVNSEGDVLEMDSAAAATSYATTMGRLNTLSFEKVVEHADDGGFIPGYGALSVLASTALVAAVLAVRRHR